MATVFLRGGLGNQMFEYAAGLRLSKKTGTPLFVDTTFLQDRFPRRRFTYRTYDLDIFTLEPRLNFFSRVARACPVSGLWLGLDLISMKLQDLFGFSKIIKEKEEHVLSSRVLNAPGSATLFGFWQNGKYFEDVSDDIRAAFTFRHAFTGQAKEIATQIQSTESISLHVRRSDYLHVENVENLGKATTLDYYDAAITSMVARVKNPYFFIFSDDITWCKEHIKTGFPTTFLDDASAGPKASFHLQLMSLCKYNIIANSTFSWWGAWLNANPQKIVITPKRWLANAEVNIRDVIPAAWEVL